jgi:hypothetical protein
MNANTLPSAKRRRIAIAVGVAAALTGILAGCGQSVASTASHPAPGETATASPAPSSTASTLHMITNQGHRLAFHVTPGHLPAIVLDAGGENRALL